MEPKEFRKRYLGSIPKGTPRFVKYKKSIITRMSLRPKDSAILIHVGLPRSTAPFIEFRAYNDAELDGLTHLVPNRSDYFIIGLNGSGDAIAIELKTGHVVSFNHDLDFEKIFINSSIESLAECICLYKENWKFTSPDELLAKLIIADPMINESKGFWKTEIVF